MFKIIKCQIYPPKIDQIITDLSKKKPKKTKKEKKQQTTEWFLFHRFMLIIELDYMSEDETRSDCLFEIQQNQAVWSDLRLFQFTV